MCIFNDKECKHYSDPGIKIYQKREDDAHPFAWSGLRRDQPPLEGAPKSLKSSYQEFSVEGAPKPDNFFRVIMIAHPLHKRPIRESFN